MGAKELGKKVGKKCCDWGWNEIPPGTVGRSWLITNPFAFGLLRLLFCVYLIGVLGYALWRQEFMSSVGLSQTYWWTFWIFNTNWNYTLLIWYFGITSIWSMYVWRRNPQTQSKWELYIWITYQTAWSGAWVVAIGYWGLLVGLGCARTNTCSFDVFSWHGHGMNVAFILVETILNRLKFHSVHVWAAMIFAAVWEIFSACWFGGTGYWTYTIQDPTVMPAWFAGLFWPIFVLAYIIFFFLGMLVQFVSGKMCARCGKLPSEEEFESQEMNPI